MSLRWELRTGQATGVGAFRTKLVFPADVGRGAARTSTARGLLEWVGARFLADRYRTAMLRPRSRARGVIGPSRLRDSARLAMRCRRVVGALRKLTFAGRLGMPRRILSLVTVAAI
ncbi:hypothetical protein CU254_37460 [Amycolatopsis sp. AA4]|nr:hypothetical protein CU254_37460 [Amycolatopsis sp. AA4]